MRLDYVLKTYVELGLCIGPHDNINDNISPPWLRYKVNFFDMTWWHILIKHMYMRVVIEVPILDQDPANNLQDTRISMRLGLNFQSSRNQ